MPIQEKINDTIVSYSFTDLGTFGGRTSEVRKISDNGTIVGYDTKNEHSLFAPSYIEKSYAAKWSFSPATPTRTEIIADAGSKITCLNNKGLMTGSSVWSSTGNGKVLQATVWTETQAINLGSLNDNSYRSEATSVNDAGQITGISYLDSKQGSYHAVKWQDGNISDLGTLGGRFSQANSINKYGVIAGWSEDANQGSMHATIWNGDQIIIMHSNYSHSLAKDINDNGVVVGAVSGEHVNPMASVWVDQRETVLSTGDSLWSRANAVNNMEQIVGYVRYANEELQHASLWLNKSSTAIDLNDFIDPAMREASWVLTDARDINEQGDIVGTALNTLTYQSHAYLLKASNLFSPAPVVTITGVDATAFSSAHLLLQVQ